MESLPAGATHGIPPSPGLHDRKPAITLGGDESCGSARSRSTVVQEALTWLRTPYHHRGAIKGVGADCAHFPLRVYAACGLIESFDPGDYPPDWHLHRSEERYLSHVRAHSREIDPTHVQQGDFVVFRVGRCFSHGAIVVAWPRIVHAVLGRGVTLDGATGGKLGKAARKAFTLWN